MDTSPAPQTPRPDPVFRAFVVPVKRHYGRWIAGILIVAAAAYALASRRDPHSYTVISPHGIRQVRLEMTENQVLSVLGKPISGADGDDCYRYGMPQLNRDFDVYKICFSEGRVQRVETERFEVREVPLPDGAEELGASGAEETGQPSGAVNAPGSAAPGGVAPTARSP